MNEIRLYVHGYITAASLVSQCVLNIYIYRECTHTFFAYIQAEAIMTIILFKKKTKKFSTSLLANEKNYLLSFF
jgi:hypothetical protein